MRKQLYRWLLSIYHRGIGTLCFLTGLRWCGISLLCILRWWGFEEVVVWCSLCTVFRVLHCITHKRHLNLSLIFGLIFTFCLQVPTAIALRLLVSGSVMCFSGAVEVLYYVIILAIIVIIRTF